MLGQNFFMILVRKSITRSFVFNFFNENVLFIIFPIMKLINYLNIFISSLNDKEEKNTRKIENEFEDFQLRLKSF